MPKWRQTKTATNQNGDTPKRRQPKQCQPKWCMSPFWRVTILDTIKMATCLNSDKSNLSKMLCWPVSKTVHVTVLDTTKMATNPKRRHIKTATNSIFWKQPNRRHTKTVGNVAALVAFWFVAILSFDRYPD